MMDAPASEAFAAAGHPAPRQPRVTRLLLSDFRSYPALDLVFEGPVAVLTGDNGAGKTNLIEALSMLAPGRGLRRAEAAELAREGGGGGWAVSARLAEDGSGEAPRRLGTGLLPGEPARRCRIDGAAVPSAAAFADHLRVVWLTPAMDGLFAGPGAERRRFLDRVVLTLDAEHGSRVNALERGLRNRNRLLEEGRAGPLDRAWLDAAEQEVARLAVAVAAARVDAVGRLRALVASTLDAASPFPWADIALEGEVEAMLAAGSALDAEDRYRAMLRAGRARDAAAGRTVVGPHRSDLSVRHGPKGVPAAQSSTGEQKALLVGLVLAQARLVAATTGIAPLVLLDEVAAHFDPRRRAALFADLGASGGQVMMTGADPGAFAEARDAARYLVVPGAVTRAR